MLLQYMIKQETKEPLYESQQHGHDVPFPRGTVATFASVWAPIQLTASEPLRGAIKKKQEKVCTLGIIH